MRDVAAWCDIYDEYLKKVEAGELLVQSGCGLAIHLYNALPTINLFRTHHNYVEAVANLTISDDQIVSELEQKPIRKGPLRATSEPDVCALFFAMSAATGLSAPIPHYNGRRCNSTAPKRRSSPSLPASRDLLGRGKKYGALSRCRLSSRAEGSNRHRSARSLQGARHHYWISPI